MDRETLEAIITHVEKTMFVPLLEQVPPLIRHPNVTSKFVTAHLYRMYAAHLKRQANKLDKEALKETARLGLLPSLLKPSSRARSRSSRQGKPRKKP